MTILPKTRIHLLFRVFLILLTGKITLLVVNTSSNKRFYNGELTSKQQEEMKSDYRWDVINNKSQLTSGNIKCSSDVMHPCTDVLRPQQQDILWRNKAWQYMVAENHTYYAMNAYYDNRHHLHTLRLIGEFAAPINRSQHILDGALFALLWYEGQPQPLCAALRQEDVGMVTWWRIQGEQLAFMHHILELPTGCPVPDYVSIATSCCPKQPLTMFLPVVKSEKPVIASNKIGACVKAIFGNLTHLNASYIVTWLESMRHFGVHKAHIYYDALTMDRTVERIFQHYVATGFITFDHVVHRLYDSDVETISDAMSQSVVGVITNDCFYRHLHDYRYTLHIDLDEILVPRYDATYTQLIDRHMMQHPADVTTVAVCVRSAYFYLYMPAGSPAEPEYLPTYRYTMRQPTELPGVTDTVGVGIRKCFQSNLHTRLMSIHGSFGLSEREGVSRSDMVMLDPDSELLIHHYRWSCKIQRRCATEHERSFHDETFHKHTSLRQQIIDVFEQVGVFHEN